jgi:hypothetical protein
VNCETLLKFHSGGIDYKAHFINKGKDSRSNTGHYRINEHDITTMVSWKEHTFALGKAYHAHMEILEKSLVAFLTAVSHHQRETPMNLFLRLHGYLG